MMWRLTMVLLLMVAAAPAYAQATRTTNDFRWLAGRWEGHVGSDPAARAEVTFSAPNARSIVGTMRLVKNDTVLVVELISLVDTPAGVEMRFSHFSMQLEAYESTYKQAMRLTSFDATQDVFENTVPFDKALMSTQPRTMLHLDYANFKSDIEGLRAEVSEADAEIQREPKGTVLVLIDLRDTVASGAVVQLFKESSALTDPYVRRHALIGVTGIKRYLADKVEEIGVKPS